MNELTNNQFTADDISEVGVTIIKEQIIQAVDGLNNTSKEKYECKKKLIENADDMTTQEKLDALDKNYDRHASETWNIIVTFGLFSLAVVGLASGSPTIIKNVRKLIA